MTLQKTGKKQADLWDVNHPTFTQSYPQAIKFDFDYILGLNIVQRVLI